MKLSRFFISLCVNYMHLDSVYTLIKEHTCISALSLIVWIPRPLGGQGGLKLPSTRTLSQKYLKLLKIPIFNGVFITYS